MHASQGSLTLGPLRSSDPGHRLASILLRRRRRKERLSARHGIAIGMHPCPDEYYSPGLPSPPSPLSVSEPLAPCPLWPLALGPRCFRVRALPHPPRLLFPCPCAFHSLLCAAKRGRPIAACNRPRQTTTMRGKRTPHQEPLHLQHIALCASVQNSTASTLFQVIISLRP
jgi:hypothetical protein